MKKNITRLRIGKMAAGVAMASLFGFLFAANVVLAQGVGIGVIPNFPVTATPGQTAVPVSLSFTNLSASTTPMTVDHIFMTPSCGNTGVTCITTDKNVFSVSSTGTGADACVGVNFTTSVSNSTTGEVEFTPSAPLSLAQNAKCTINFTIDVLKVPATDADGVNAGVQTGEIGHVTGHINTLSGEGSGTDETTINKASPTIATTLSATSVAVGTAVHDGATLSNATTNAGGSVTYNVYAGSACSGSPVFTNTQSVTNAVVPNSSDFTPSTAGTYNWQAVYSGDANNNPATSPCQTETLTVTKANPSIGTTLSATSVNIGTAVHDSSALSGATSNASGTVTYTVYTDSACTQGAQGAGIKTVTNGVVPDSDPITFNTSGTYNWQAVYSGDANNNGATSPCQSEVLVVNKVAPSIATVPSAGGLVGTNVSDSATVTGGSSPTGTVTFKLYAPSDATCAAAAIFTDSKPLSGGSAGPSAGFVTLLPGTYHWIATYNGDSNNNSVSGHCADESVVITQNQPTIATTLSAGTVNTNTAVHDSSALTGATSDAGGTVTYSAYAGNACTGTPVFTSQVTVSNAIVPDSANFTPVTAGTYNFQAVYSGDAKNLGATSACGTEVLTVNQPQLQYCSPGYWKQTQHFHSYVAPYAPTSLFDTVFNVSAFPSNMTLVQVLSQGGGGLNAYGRAAVGALLNAAALNSGLTTAQVIALVHTTITNAPTSGNTNGYYGSANPEFTAPENCLLN